MIDRILDACWDKDEETPALDFASLSWKVSVKQVVLLTVIPIAVEAQIIGTRISGIAQCLVPAWMQQRQNCVFEHRRTTRKTKR